LAAKGSAEFLHIRQLNPASNGMGAIVCMLAFYSALRAILSSGPVNMERISAALSLYLLIGLVFGVLYAVIEELVPSSFVIQVASGSKVESFQLAHSIYFSFVTLGTLGYGDVVPISGPSRALAVTEAMIGQMYIAVVVARLVALYKGEDQPEELRRGGDEVDPTA
jgi:voltage-gated potassium channel Kch